MKTSSTSGLREKCRVGIPSSKSSSVAPDLTISHHGSILLFHPLTKAARDWMREHCPADADHLYFGGALVVEPRHAQDLAARAQADGLNRA